jgi:hypothetical protein
MHGIGVSEGIAIGQAHLFAGMSAEANHYEIAPPTWRASSAATTAR